MSENQSNNNGYTNGTNGFTSKDMLMQLWTKVESIDSKLDQKFGEHERRLITLELQSIARKDFFDLEHRVTNIEKHDETHHATEEALQQSQNQKITNKNFVFNTAASIALVLDTILSLYMFMKKG